MNVVTELSLKKLSEELDSLGLPSLNINVDIIEQLTCSMYKLIQMHRKTVTGLNDMALQKTITDNEKRSYQKGIETLNEKLKSHESNICGLKETILRIKYEKDDLRAAHELLNNNLNTLKSMYNTSELEYKHVIARLKLENSELRDKFGLYIGKYKSYDTITVEVINKYKAKHLIYEDTIQKLQNNNKGLIDEILNLKEEVLLALYNKDVLS